MALTSIQDYAPVLAQRDERGESYLLVGGQAVNFWADTYKNREPRLLEFDPFLSKDLDLLATAAEGQRIAAAIGWEFVPSEPDAVNIQGKLRQGSLEVELLSAQGRPLLPPEHGLLKQPAGTPAIPLRLISPEARFLDETSKIAAIQPTLAILASVRRGTTGQRFAETYPGVLRWGELLPPSVRALPLDVVYRRCLEQLDAPVR